MSTLILFLIGTLLINANSLEQKEELVEEYKKGEYGWVNGTMGPLKIYDNIMIVSTDMPTDLIFVTNNQQVVL